MNILVVSYWFPPEGGGGEVSMSLLAKGLAKHHKVICANTTLEGESDDILYKKFSFNRKIPVLFDLKLDKYLRQIIKEDEIDVIHTNDFRTVLPAILASRKTGIKCVITVRDYWPFCSKAWRLDKDFKECLECSLSGLVKCRGIKRWPWEAYKHYKIKYIQKQMMKNKKITVVTVDDYIHKSMSDIGIKNIRIFNPHDKEIFSDPSQIEKGNKLREGYDLQDKFVVLFSGSFIYVKGIYTMIEVCKKLETEEDIVFVFVGDGELQDEISSCKNAIVYGRAKIDEMPSLYHLCDVVAYPLLSHAQGRIPIEAFYCGKPVLSSPRGFVTDGENGFVISNADELAEKIILLSKDSHLRERMGEKAKKIASNFTIEKSVSKYEKVYQNQKQG